ncbi:hypothetical protein [Actinacidiphila glaucinigra]|uniref:hypothetical protein n=1 Tax=Actinacidiphila glaucinigra TaxID=235986 RepID=UPI003D8DDF7F
MESHQARVAHIYEAVQVLRKAGEHPPEGWEAEAALEALLDVPSHRLIRDGRTPDGLKDLLAETRTVPAVGREALRNEVDRERETQGWTGQTGKEGTTSADSTSTDATATRHGEPGPRVEERFPASLTRHSSEPGEEAKRGATRVSAAHARPNHRLTVGDDAPSALSREELEETAKQAAAAVRGTGPRVSAHPRTIRSAWPEDACVRLVEELAQRIYPNSGLLGGDKLPGVLSSETVDDIKVGSRSVEARLAPGPGWQRVSSWDVIQKAVREQKPGTAAFVLAGKQSSIGHAFAVYHAANSEDSAESQAVWVDPLNPSKNVLFDKVPEIPPSHARAIIIAPDGRPVTDALPRFQESTSIGHSIIDPIRDHRYGAVGIEVEVAQPLVTVQGDDDVFDFSGHVLARHSSGVQVMGDVLDFWPDRDGVVLHATPQTAGQQTYHLIPEIVPPAINTLQGDEGRISQSEAMRLLTQTWRNLAAPPAPLGTKIPLSQILTPEDGWKVSDDAIALHVLNANPKASVHAYGQYTLGVPVDGIANVFDMALSGLATEQFTPFFAAGRNFGIAVAADYATQLTGRTVQLHEVRYLTNVPGVQQVLGFSWLVFNHAGAVPLWRRFFDGSGIIVKNLLPAASRVPLHEIRKALDTNVKEFFTEYRTSFSNRFISALGENFETHGRTMEEFPIGKLGLDEKAGVDETDMTLRDVLDSALEGKVETKLGHPISQGVLIGMREDYLLDNNGGKIETPLVLIELRHFVPGNHNFVEHGEFSSPGEVNIAFQKTVEVARASYRHAQALQEQVRTGFPPAQRARRTLDVFSAWVSLAEAAQEVSARHESGTVQQLLTAEEVREARRWVVSFAESGKTEPALGRRLQELVAATVDVKPKNKTDRTTDTADPLKKARAAAQTLLDLLSPHEGRNAGPSRQHGLATSPTAQAASSHALADTEEDATISSTDRRGTQLPQAFLDVPRHVSRHGTQSTNGQPATHTPSRSSTNTQHQARNTTSPVTMRTPASTHPQSPSSAVAAREAVTGEDRHAAAYGVEEPPDSAGLVRKVETLARLIATQRTSAEVKESWRQLTNVVDAQLPQYRHWLTTQTYLMQTLSGQLPEEWFGELAARMMIHADIRCDEPATARHMAIAEISPMLRNQEITIKLLSIGSVIGIFPKDMRVAAAVPGFSQESDDVRGVTDHLRPVVVVGEERITGRHSRHARDAVYAMSGYSTLLHELGHLIHIHGFGESDKQVIYASFLNKKEGGRSAEWSSGTRLIDAATGKWSIPYSAKDHFEYFAENFAAWAGSRWFDPANMEPTRTGRQWLLAHDKNILLLLERHFGTEPPVPSDSFNPMFAVAADEHTHEGFVGLFSGVDAAGEAASELASLPSQERAAQLRSWALQARVNKDNGPGHYLAHPLFLLALESLEEEMPGNDHPTLLDHVHAAALTVVPEPERATYILTRMSEETITALLANVQAIKTLARHSRNSAENTSLQILSQEEHNSLQRQLAGAQWVHRLARMDPRTRLMTLAGNTSAISSVFGDPLPLAWLINALPPSNATELDETFTVFLQTLHAGGKWQNYVNRMPPAVRDTFTRVSREGGPLWSGSPDQNPYDDLISWFHAVGVARRLTKASHTRREALLVNIEDFPPALNPRSRDTRALFAAVPAPERWRLLQWLEDVANAEKVRAMDSTEILSMFLDDLATPRLNAFFDVTGLARRRLERQLAGPEYANLEKDLHAARQAVNDAHRLIEISNGDARLDFLMKLDKHRSRRLAGQRGLFGKFFNDRKSPEAYRSLVDFEDIQQWAEKLSNPQEIENSVLSISDEHLHTLSLFREELRLSITQQVGELWAEYVDSLLDNRTGQSSPGDTIPASTDQALVTQTHETSDTAQSAVVWQAVNDAQRLTELTTSASRHRFLLDLDDHRRRHLVGQHHLFRKFFHNRSLPEAYQSLVDFEDIQQWAEKLSNPQEIKNSVLSISDEHLHTLSLFREELRLSITQQVGELWAEYVDSLLDNRTGQSSPGDTIPASTDQALVTQTHETSDTAQSAAAPKAAASLADSGPTPTPAAAGAADEQQDSNAVIASSLKGDLPSTARPATPPPVTPEVLSSQAPGFRLGPWVLPVKAILHESKYSLRKLLGGDGSPRTIARLAEVLNAPRSNTDQHALLVDATFASLVAQAAHRIRLDLAGTSPNRLRARGLNNSKLVVTIDDNPQVGLVLTQKLANEIEYRIHVQLSPGEILIICPDLPDMP